ncbi:MAG: hypothetical protein RIB30_14865 [Thalassospira sp.]|uniref:hypothetical protein n=1 Tax=Thalassospira sp. TaxID=1912094 RepID=UPI0032EAD90F
MSAIARVRVGVTVSVIVGAISALLFVSMVDEAVASDCLIFATPENTVGKLVAQNFEAVVASTGLCAKVLELPPEQSEQMFRAGEIDGELTRITDYSDYEQRGMIRVETPSIEGQALLVSFDPTLKSVPELDGRLLGMLRGIEWQRDMARDHENRVYLPNNSVMIEMLSLGRIDAMLIDSITFKRLGGLLASPSRVIIGYRNVYIWMQPRHSDIAPVISDALAKFQSTGKSLLDQTD